MGKAQTIIKNRKKYDMSQIELAKLLGMSRPTLAKVEKGERALKDSEKQKLKEVFMTLEGDEGYERINIPQKNIEKFKQVLLYILQKVGAKPNVGMTVLYKLLYFIDFDYYEKYEVQLMGLTYFKNTHGPSPREFKKVVDEMSASGELEAVRSTYYKKEQKKFLPHVEPNLSLLDGRELEMIDSVLDRYSDKSARELSEMSHRDMPWMAAKPKQNLEYEHAFYRPDEFSVREYDEL